MEVIESDFERTADETRKAEEHAVQDHEAFTEESEKSMKEKEDAKEAKTTQKDDTTSKLSSDQESLEEKSKAVTGAVKELLELHPVCIASGMSYDERVERRADEIAALKKGLCILTNYAQFGPDSSVNQC